MPLLKSVTQAGQGNCRRVRTCSKSCGTHGNQLLTSYTYIHTATPTGNVSLHGVSIALDRSHRTALPTGNCCSHEAVTFYRRARCCGSARSEKILNIRSNMFISMTMVRILSLWALVIETGMQRRSVFHGGHPPMYY